MGDFKALNLFLDPGPLMFGAIESVPKSGVPVGTRKFGMVLFGEGFE